MATLECIHHDFEACAEKIRGLEAQSARLALGTVEGDPASQEALRDVMLQLRDARGDLLILRNAFKAAAERDVASAEAARLEREASAKARARQAAGTLYDAALLVDARVSDLIAAIDDLRASEAALHDLVRQAGLAPETSRVGRRGLGQLAVTRAKLAIEGRGAFAIDKRPTAEVARSAWSDLLHSERAEND